MAANRKRDSSATRDAIALAARNQFAEHGYDAAGLRQIADEAGVNVALINRYFGSKEGLFKEVIIPTLRYDELLEDGVAGFIDRILEIKRNAYIAKTYDPTLVVIRTLHSQVAGPLVRAALREQVLNPIIKLLPGPQAEERAEMIGVLLLGYDMYNRGTEMPGGTSEAQALLRRTLEFLIGE